MVVNARFHEQFGEKSLKARHFDLDLGSDGNILETCGFLSIFKMVLKLKPNALMVGGPPCGSWVWMNRSTSKRTRENRLW